jgi:trehalose synthase
MTARPRRVREASLRKVFLRRLASVLLLGPSLVLLAACPHTPPSAPIAPANAELAWLEQRSMLAAAPALSQTLAANGQQWRQPYGLARPRDFLDLASVWFNAYPASLITGHGDTFLQGLGDPSLLAELEQVGIQAIHTGPVKLAGSVRGESYRPTIDGNFDRIQLAIDPAFGDEAQYEAMVGVARQHGIAIVGDIIPGHTGMGPDFRLAELGVPGYASLYAMAEIRESDWKLLPAVPAGEDSANLSHATALALKQKGYILGPLDAVIFARPGIKESNWSATGVVRGIDGRERRFVYLHLFKAGQPTLNWLDPSFAAARLVSADIVHSLRVLGARGLRLDANMFLGFGPRRGDEDAWLIEHPLSTVATELLAMMIRKMGGFSFQELNASLEKIHSTLATGPELAYDFTTRPVYLYALATGDAGPLRLMLRQMLANHVDPGRMVHALQNHDELMLEESHLRVHGDEVFTYEGGSARGSELFVRIHERVTELVAGTHGPYNERFAMSPGVCSTLAGFTAASLGMSDVSRLTPEQVARIEEWHLAAAAYNALLPGAFVVSGWDLVGALPLPREAVRPRLADDDCRWLNRGAYDLAGVNPHATASSDGLPRAVALYGTLAEQLRQPASFASRLRELLSLRKRLGVAGARLVAVPEVKGAGLVLTQLELPATASAEGTRHALVAVNFGREALRQPLPITSLGASPKLVFSSEGVRTGRALETEDGVAVLELAPAEYAVVLP